MITCQVTYLSRSHKGDEVRRETPPVTAEVLTLGRGNTCHVPLKDVLVRPAHAVIWRSEDGRLLVKAVGDATLGQVGTQLRLLPIEPGAYFTVGTTSVRVVEASGNRLRLTVIESDQGESPTGKPPDADIPLNSAVAERRSWQLGITLASVILLLFLATLLTRTSLPFEAWQARLPITLTGFLTPGSLSPAHELVGARCSTCHRTAFTGVADSACVDCHAAIGKHREKVKPGPDPSLDPPCIACHIAHRNKAAVVNTRSATCVDCHARHETRLGAIRDFGETHAPFRLAIFDGKKETGVREDAAIAPREKPNLKFSHAAHLREDGVASPEGQTILDCTSCHRLDEAGRSFDPPRMEAGCQQSGCHRARFADPMRGVVPHASVRELMDRMRAFFAARLADDPVEFRQRCGGTGQTGSAGRRLLDCAHENARDAAARSLFRQSGDELACALCHELVDTGHREVPWKILPVRRTAKWHSSAEFPHFRHTTIKCGDCHSKGRSKEAADLSIPGIAKCRECHAGPAGSQGKLSTDCADCHSFHRHRAAQLEATR
jgi:hypothetical protein